ncbi:SCO family protein [Fictibacillus nanhaiensis]|uniref:SCO family protein n=1 Tax=Fictibacillus nanhaiensis TaxID=742169 RepID=UPI001C98A66A|nr:SCO family protein [Fictibacillus nanhaiensis]MBY6037722.1 SCO family protein [Fictibacillus nanhaiensis]
MKKMIVVLCLTLVLSACGSKSHDEHENHKQQDSSKEEASQSLDWDVQSFTFKDQNNESFGSTDLTNKVWMANFIFTNCETVCPPMTAHMAKLQQMAKEEGVEVDFVSFSIDPKRDNAKALTKFGENYDADFSNWHFVGGYEQDEIEKFAKESFKTPITADPNSDQFIHATAFFLVDKNGKVVSRYDGVENTPYKQIIEDMKKEAKK